MIPKHVTLFNMLTVINSFFKILKKKKEQFHSVKGCHNFKYFGVKYKWIFEEINNIMGPRQYSINSTDRTVSQFSID